MVLIEEVGANRDQETLNPRKFQSNMLVRVNVHVFGRGLKGCLQRD